MTEAEAKRHVNDYAMTHGTRTAGTLLSADTLEDPDIFPDLIDADIISLPPADCLKVGQVLDYSILTADAEEMSWILPDMVDRYNKNTTNMTIKELIDKVQEEKPNTFSDEKLLSFVNEVEQDVYEQLVEEFTPYTSLDDTHLRVPAPYDRLYVSYLKAMIDYANEEYLSYENNQAQHVQDFRDFIDWVVRENRASKDHVMTKRFRNVF